MVRPNKRTAVLDAARRAFASLGDSVPIDAIAADAGVSTRTIYNHFPGGKDELFAVAIAESAGHVADALVAAIARHLDGAEDLHAALAHLARAWLAPRQEYREHFAMVRRMRADAERLPTAIRDAWHAAGPERAVGELADRLAAFASEGRLAIDDAGLAASHYLSLTVGEVWQREVDDAAADELLCAGVRVFMQGYGAEDRHCG